MWEWPAVQTLCMEGHLITVDGDSPEIAAATLRRLIDSSTRFGWIWPARTKTLAGTVLRDIFRFHPLAVEDAEHFGQRPKLDTYDGYPLMVVYAPPLRARRSPCTAFTPRPPGDRAPRPLPGFQQSARHDLTRHVAVPGNRHSRGRILSGSGPPG
jgi:hypothetical protein